MTYPVYKVETYTGTVLDYTITGCVTLNVKTVLTDSPGTFTFSVPAVDGAGTNQYDGIALFDKVKIYMGYDTVPSTPLFVGRVENIQTTWNREGIIRVISGHDLGEVATRRLLTQYNTVGTTAHLFMDKLAGNLSLNTTDIAADATAVDIITNSTKYDLMIKDVCDYAATISKDWYVDTNNDLNWKTRPIRTVGVESLTTADFIDYKLTRNVNEVFNNFYVFGASEPSTGASKCADAAYTVALSDVPADHVDWTQAHLGDWTHDSFSDTETVQYDAVFNHIAPKCIDVYVADANENEWVWGKVTPGDIIRIKDSADLNFCFRWKNNNGTPVNNIHVSLYSGASDLFQYNIATADQGVYNTWKHHTLECGPQMEAAAGDSKWVRSGNPDWLNITGILFYLGTNCAEDGQCQFYVDGIYFSNMRWNDYDYDATSQTNYGQRDMIVTDDRIHTSTAVSNYAAMLKARYKDAPIQLNFTTLMNTNIIIGDRLPLTLSVDGLTAQNFDVIKVEHNIDESGAYTKAILTSNERTRSPLKVTDFNTVVKNMKVDTQNLASNLQIQK